MTRLEGKIRAASRRLLQSLEAGPQTIADKRRYGGKSGGPMLYAAAQLLVSQKKATIIGVRKERITFGPKPHDKYRTVIDLVKTADDAI